MENNNLIVYKPNNEEINTKDLRPEGLQNNSDIDCENASNEFDDHSDPNENNNDSVHPRLGDQPLSPTQAQCLMTTVPQNIAARTLGDKHTPTRNSLRHSRMIVMNRNGKIPKKYLPFIIRNYRLVKTIKVLTIILGILMCLMSVFLIIWCSTLKALDFPYWSAVPVLISGIVGCFFLGFCPRPYPGRRLGWYYHLVKFASVLTTAISIMSTIMVLTLGIIHLVYLHKASCMPHDKFNTTCVCSMTNSTSTLFNESYHYEDLTCEEVEHFLQSIVLTSCFLNVLAAVLEVTYLWVHWASSRKYVYAKIPLSEAINANGT